jgi:cytochrome c biogenesis protein CcdA/thiol-disulfide isomerase/thioredoxin
MKKLVAIAAILSALAIGLSASAADAGVTSPGVSPTPLPTRGPVIPGNDWTDEERLCPTCKVAHESVATDQAEATTEAAGEAMTGLADHEAGLPARAAEEKVVIYLFWGDGCPHCAAEKPFLEQLTQRNPRVEVRAYEVWYDEANRDKFMAMAAAYGFEPQAVPTTFLGDQYWIGYSDQMGQEIEREVLRCLEAGCKDAGAGILAPAEDEPAVAEPDPPTMQPASLELPLLGAIGLEHQSLAVSTALIAFVDGFNPCSLWVLTMLLAITLHTGSRKKVLVIGLVFLTVTAAVYALFIAGLFTVFTFVGFTGWIQLIVALVALFFAAVNIKDYFWYKEGLSLTIADEQKPGLFQRMRGLVDASRSFWGLLAATVVFAAGVSLVEFSCTAGFPMIWTNLLSAQQVGAATFLALLAVYLLIYQLDELAVFFVSVFTLKATRMEEKHGRILKLIGGMLMLTLATVMLADPSLMNNLGSSLLIFGAALGATLLVLAVHRAVLPRFGVWIGTEASPAAPQSSRPARRSGRRR